MADQEGPPLPPPGVPLLRPFNRHFLPYRRHFHEAASRGCLGVSGSSAPAIPITIWLHQDYSTVGPKVFVSATPGCSIYSEHPFVDPSSGLNSMPYLSKWSHPRCSLYKLARNLIKLFLNPFWSLPPSLGGPANPALVSKTEALDRLSGMIHYDMTVLRSRGDDEVEDLLRLQEELHRQSTMASRVVHGLESKRADLEGKVRELEREAGKIYEWLDGPNSSQHVLIQPRGDTEDVIDSVFEVVGEKSRLTLDCLASERAIEETIYALDKAIEIGAVSFETYTKQVRILAREHFQFIAMRMKLDVENTFHQHAPFS